MTRLIDKTAHLMQNLLIQGFFDEFHIIKFNTRIFFKFNSFMRIFNLILSPTKRKILQ